jgi:uncharacterized protein Smg (DUF494 family)
MNEILIYLFRSYPSPAHQPRAEALVRRLKAAGFDAEAIDIALEWLGSFEDSGASTTGDCGMGFRIYSAAEQAVLGSSGIGLLRALEDAGQLTPPGREQVVDQAMKFGGALSGRRLRLVVLAVLRRHGRLDPLLIESLAGDFQRSRH